MAAVAVLHENHKEQKLDALLQAERRYFVRIAYKFLGSVDDAEDAVQDASVKALRHIDQWTGEGTIKSWFGMIVANSSRMALRRELPIKDQEYRGLDMSGIRSSINIEMDAERRERFLLIRDAMERLSDSDHQTILRMLSEGKPLTNTQKTQRRRALEKLRRILSPAGAVRA